jgi:predicted anti-sigma-YlaC factor YlaD
VSAEEHTAVRMMLGGYLLGGLDEADEHRVDAHLRTCAECRDELRYLDSVPTLLHRLPQGMPDVATTQPPPVPLKNLLNRVRANRRRTRIRLVAGAVAAMLLVVLGFAVVVTREPKPAGPTAPSGTTLQFTGTSTGQAVLTPKTWGVSVAVHLAGLPPAGPYALQVVGRDGHVEQAATWGPTPTGGANVTGASSMQLGTVQEVRITGGGGELLATATT